MRPFPPRLERAARTVSWAFPIATVAAFVALYALAARVYPGSSRTQAGFSLLHTYWCDLLDESAYAGRSNPARPVAILAMAVLSGGLAALWAAAPRAFENTAPRRAWVVRVAGVGCALAIPWVGMGFHDLAVRLGGLFGAVAFVTTLTALRPEGWTGRLRAGGQAVLALAVLNYVIWESRVGIQLLPSIQKVAFVALLLWVVLFAWHLRSA